MGIFNRTKGGPKKETAAEKEVKWIPLESSLELEKLMARSSDRPQLLFKNSVTCGISSIVRRSLESNLSGLAEEADLYLLHVQYHRELSNTVSETFGVRHETPQLLVIKDGRVVSHASHGGITMMDLQDYQ